MCVLETNYLAAGGLTDGVFFQKKMKCGPVSPEIPPGQQFGLPSAFYHKYYSAVLSQKLEEEENPLRYCLSYLPRFKSLMSSPSCSHIRCPQWTIGKVKVSGPKGSRIETRFLCRTAAYVGLLHVKSYVGGQTCSCWCVVEVWGGSSSSGVVLVI
ncbi:hypothetical protein AVEN_111655-1 [Araneus ventricosus]|uniref:Uncharacterized protein n=1 Tax=Araneus ventricosus TaxID=182803 RepID=A0A4Y2C476_ARAVE|nr:hypothetical protein AVEN_111655-1 [Araneus ventricosus]